MTKLSARGHHVIVRFSKELEKPATIKCGHCEGGKHLRDLIVRDKVYYKTGDVCTLCNGKGEVLPLTKWEKKTIALMSNGKVLEKLDVIFHPNFFDLLGRKHSYGWKVKGKIKAGLTVEDFVAIYEKSGFTKEKSRG